VDQDLHEREYVVLLSEDCRIRHYHNRTKSQILEFLIQLETSGKGKWKPVVRYDTAHGYAHRDIIHADGKIEKLPLSFGDYNSALTFAEMDIRSNWELYRKRFLEEEREYDR
jgi:hypothetical protein